MDKKPEGELPQNQPEQSEKEQEKKIQIKQAYEKAIKYLDEELNLEDDKYFGLGLRNVLDSLKEAGDKRFVTSLMKIYVDWGYRNFKEDLKKAETEGKLYYTYFGHTPNDVASRYDQFKEQIPETEIELHKLGEEFLQSARVYYGYDRFNPESDRYGVPRFEEAIKFYESMGLTDLADELRKLHSLMEEGKEKRDEAQELHLEILKKQAERIFSLFPEELVSKEEAKKIIRQTIDDIQNSLKDLA